MCGSPRLCPTTRAPLIGARFGRWRKEIFGRARCLTLRYSLLLSVWVDPSAEHSSIISSTREQVEIGCVGQKEPRAAQGGEEMSAAYARILLVVVLVDSGQKEPRAAQGKEGVSAAYAGILVKVGS